MLLYSYSSTLRPPPTPTLFPYTTLFRSLLVGLHGHMHMAAAHQLLPRGYPVPLGQPLVALVHAEGGTDRQRGGGQDRKSTRLNSSHVEISYAVFCLKKKKKH